MKVFIVQEEAHYGFKMVDEMNLLAPDPLMGSMATRENDVVRPMIPNDLLQPILAVTLEERVPFEVRRAFFFARNAMCYGYWYYPLITLGSQQLLRVADYATEVAGSVNGLTPHRNFRPRIDQLVAAGVIDSANRGTWELICRFRNKATHPEWQQIWGIPQTLNVVRAVANEITAMRWPEP
jgi:hypothetical protein